MRKVSIATADSRALAAILEGTPERLARGNDISHRLEASDAADAVVIPMVVKEKISGAVYADAVPGEEHRFDPDGIAALTFLTGLVVDRLATRKLRPAPPLRPIPGPPERPAEEDISDLGIPRPREVPLTPSAEPPARVGEACLEGSSERGGFRAEHSRSALRHRCPSHRRRRSLRRRPMEWADSPGATVRLPEIAAESVVPPTPMWKAEEPAEAPAPPVAPPAAPGRRLAGPLARSEGDERREEARRFAKLLVSEIKLYNERAVQEGREQGNLYQRLKEDIDRSRQMYDERIPEDVRSNTNFFHEELVRTLADGRAEALGI